MSYRPTIASGQVLAIDLGTGGPKAAIVDAEGRTIAWASAAVATTFLPGGGAEQDPVEMWAAVVHACRAALAACPATAEIAAVAVTSQYMSVVPVRSDGTPTGPCVMWMDSRGAAHNLGLLDEESFGLFVERHGLIPLPSGNDNVAHISVLREVYPDSYAAAAAFVEPMDYVNARLTGRVCATQSTAFSTLCCDNRTWGAVDYDPALVAATGLDPAKLAPLVPMNGFVGDVTPAAAAELGIRAGAPVTTATIDSITSAIGTGALGPTEGAIVIGTTSVLVSHIDEHHCDLMSGLLAVPSPLPNMYYVMAENGVGGRALEWFLRNVVYPDDALSTGAVEDPYDRVMTAAAAIPAGCAGAQFLPWLLGSIAPRPNDDVRAAFVGLGLGHTRSHLARAVLEGVALNLAWLLPAVEDFVGNRFPALRFGGGGATSPLWAQILADATGRPVDRLDSPRATNARGAAFLALAELGVLDVHDTPALLHVASHHEPDPAHRQVMDDALGRLAALHGPLANRS